MQCQFDEDAVGATMSGMVVIKPGSESELQAAVAYVGPVSVAVDASSNGFRVCVLCTYTALFLDVYHCENEVLAIVVMLL